MYVKLTILQEVILQVLMHDVSSVSIGYLNTLLDGGSQLTRDLQRSGRMGFSYVFYFLGFSVDHETSPHNLDVHQTAPIGIVS